MNADSLDSLTERVLGAIFEVSNTLGVGFLEKVYQRALLRELGLRGIPATAEASFPVVYKCMRESVCPSISWTLHYSIRIIVLAAAVVAPCLAVDRKSVV